MDTTQILRTDILDILFEGRNKAYGAYELRRTYNGRMGKALAGMVLITLSVIFYQSYTTSHQRQVVVPVIDTGDVFVRPAEKEKDVFISPELPKVIQKPAQTMESVQFTKIRIVKDNEVVNPLADIEQIQNAVIDVKTMKGDEFRDVILPPSEPEGTNVVFSPVSDKKSDEPLVKVEIDASFPGGNEAWRKYLEKAVLSASDDFSDADYGSVIVKFVVDVDGKVSDVHALNMKGSKLAEIAVNAIRRGPKWIPAQQNGRLVKAWRLQPVTLQRP